MTAMYRILLATVVLAAATDTAGAQEPPRAVLELGAGWIGFPDDGLVSETLLGGAARWHVLPRVSVGPEVVYIDGQRHHHLAATGNVTFDLRSPMTSRGTAVTPFIVVGAGLFRTREAFPAGDVTSNEGAFTAGGGVRTSGTSPVVLGLDARVGWETHLRVNGFVGVRLGR